MGNIRQGDLVFIPNRRSKAGKRFAFVRFIRVNDLDRLVGNLCMIWIGRFHLHANVARFERANKHVKPLGPSQSNAHGTFGSFVFAARDFPPLIASVAHVSSSLALVLDDSCVVERDLSCHVMGRVKDINSIPNLRILLAKEGFEHALTLGYVRFLMPIMILLVMNVLFGWTLKVSHFMFGLEKRLPRLVINRGGLDIEDKVWLLLCSCRFISDDESKAWRFIFFNDGAQNCDDESDVEMYVDGRFEIIFSDNVDECNVDGHGKETDKHQSEDPFGFYDLLNKLPTKGVRDARTSLSHLWFTFINSVTTR
ncbi:hypothetical protein Tco_1533319 [Tanacetum coccineum]